MSKIMTPRPNTLLLEYMNTLMNLNPQGGLIGNDLELIFQTKKKISRACFMEIKDKDAARPT